MMATRFLAFSGVVGDASDEPGVVYVDPMEIVAVGPPFTLQEPSTSGLTLRVVVLRSGHVMYLDDGPAIWAVIGQKPKEQP